MDEKITGLKLVNKILYKATCNEIFSEHEIDYILIYKTNKYQDKAIDFDTREVNEVAWVSKTEINDFVDAKKKSGEGFSPWFDLIRKNGLLDEFWDLVIHDKVKEPSYIPVQKLY